MAKEIFLSDKPLADWLRAITHTDDFKRCLAYASAELMEADDISSEHIAGARRFQRILLDLAEPIATHRTEYPKSGLHHSLDIEPRTKQRKEPVKKDKL